MALFLLAYLGGVLTIISPCILPVLPFVFARGERPFLRNGLPLLIGMAFMFAAVATLAAVGGGWAVSLNQYGRWLAVGLLALFGLALVFPGLSERLTRPLVSAGARLSQRAEQDARTGSALWPSFLLGIATGLLWAPCAGPILGLILTGAALEGASVRTTALLFCYAAGAATSCALALFVGKRVLALMKRSLGAGEWIRRIGGVVILAAVLAIAMGWDTGFLTRVSLARTSAFEQGLVDRLQPKTEPATSSPRMEGNSGMMMSANPAMMSGNPAMMMRGKASGTEEELGIESDMPPLTGITEWLNSPALTKEGLKGKVVLIDFWTYSCINCLRSVPYVRAWAEKYKDQGLVVIGVHAPEFAFEKNVGNVRKAVADLKITYPVAVDNDYAVWRAFNNRFWPAHYFIDAEGKVRHHHFGEGGYDESERVIQRLLAEAGKTSVSSDLVAVSASGASAPSATDDVASPETYVGYDRAENFVSPGGIRRDAGQNYAAGSPRLNEWSLTGTWTVGAEQATLNEKEGSIVYRFHARDLHLVLGPSEDGKPVRFRITIDGAPPGNAHGMDADAAGEGTVNGQRLYQLIRQGGEVKDRTFEIRFLDAGVQAFAFTFG